MVVPICSKLRGYMGKEHPLKIKIRQKFNENMDEIFSHSWLKSLSLSRKCYMVEWLGVKNDMRYSY